MATLLDFARLCDAVYQVPNVGAPPGWIVRGQMNGVGGFKGAFFQRGGLLVVAFAGTDKPKLGQLTDSAQDITADIRLMFDMPRQTSSAYELFKRAKQTCPDTERTVICGHSLGGGLTQHVAYWTKCDFVTFNAPGVYSGIQGTKVAFFHSPHKALRTWRASAVAKEPLGRNYRLPKDPISVVGMHFGRPCIDLTNSVADGTGHSMTSVIAVCQATHWGGVTPV